ncbi:ankyrin repeat-containing domain protein [Thelonectria olida]|uniref:Ankyrin repeat-containing domain protein n=1 Tax=Thelonectria olida TaxID=1576542 RepID=A0A9P9AWN7_9HYPO|nr:ankyrin repeat-containing domain protein [Thelonectria olida]
MDPLSVIANVLAVMELCAKTVKYLNQVREGPKECARLKAEVRSTEGVLRTFWEIVQDAEEGGEDWSSTIRSMNTKWGPLEQLQHSLTSLNVQLEKAAPKGGLKGLGKSLLWPLKQTAVEDLVKAIDRQKSLLMLAVENDHLSLSKQIHDDTKIIRADTMAVKEGVQRLNQGQDEQERREVIDWLAALEYSKAQSDFISRRQKGTGEWLIESKQFSLWADGSGETLFCPGMPGAGKTMITAIVVDHLCNKYDPDYTVGIAYVYCNFRQQHEQQPIDLLLSMLRQLVQKQRSVPDEVHELWSSYRYKRARPTFEEVFSVLQYTVGDFSKTYIVVDALDECCQASDSDRMKFLSALSQLQTKAEANVFATSRFIPNIERAFDGSPTLEIRATKHDVQRYMEGNISRLPGFVARNVELQKEIKDKITQAVHGMFLLAKLYMDSLIGKKSPKAIRISLNKILEVEEHKGYDHAYNEAMYRINGHVADSRELASQVLSWISCARRHLTTSELQHALAVEMESAGLDEENIPDIEDIVSVCAGLVTVDTLSDTVRLVHYTTQEYFDRNWSHWFPDATKNITTVCATYLSFETFETGPSQTDEDFENRLHENSLYDYAARNWGHHARKCSEDSEELILDLLEDESKVAAASQVLMSLRGFAGYSQVVPGSQTGMHLAAYFGLTDIIKTLLGRGYSGIDSNSFGQTPLWWAAKNGHEDAVRLLLTLDGVNVNARDSEYRQTPLWCAIDNGHDGVVALLLDRNEIDANSTDPEFGRTPLSWAARMGRVAVVKLLLAKDGVNVNSKDALYGDTALSWAARGGHKEVVQLLLAKPNIDINCKETEYQQTPLSWAARNGHDEIVKILLARNDVEMNALDEAEATPLTWAARRGNKGAVKLLLKNTKVKVSHQDIHGVSPLAWATGNGHEEVAETILENMFGAQILEGSPEDLDNRSLLSAARKGDTCPVKILLDKLSINVNYRDKFGWTPLLWAARNGHERVVRLLLGKGDTDVNIKDSFDQTPLWWAARGGHDAVVKLLLAIPSINPNPRVTNPLDRGETPLSRAARDGQEAVVRLFLERPVVDVNANDIYFRTPVLWAAREGHNAVVKMLLVREDVEVNARDKYGRTALTWAAREGREGSARLLLACKRVDPESVDVYGRRPLSWAEEHGHEAVARLLRLRRSVSE